jgi:hypothetical protein
MRPHITSLKENARLTPVIMSIRFASPTVFAILHALFVDFFYGPEALYDVYDYDVYCTGLACELSMAHGVIRRCRIRTSPLVKAHAIKIICMTIAEKFMYPIKFGGGRRRHKFVS